MHLRLNCVDNSLVRGPEETATDECYRVGRSSNCAFVLSDLSVSRYHAEVTFQKKNIVIKDMGSRNGTFVDGVRIEEAQARAGQSVRFGSAQFHVVDGDKPEIPSDTSGVSTYIVPGGPALIPPTMAADLSEAQVRVLHLLLGGKSEKEVAASLHISPHTVHNHVKMIYKKMAVNSRSELLALFVSVSKTLEKPIK